MRYQMKFGYAGPETCVSSDAACTVFTAREDSADAAYWVSWRLHAPIESTYIMIPACAYDGNRFDAVRRQYPPMFTEDELGVDAPVRMTQVPRLAREGDSFMDVTTGDMAAPCVCVLDKAAGESFMVFFHQQAGGFNMGVTLEQRGDELEITLRAPAKRRLVYRWYEGYPSLAELPKADPHMRVSTGRRVEIRHRVFTDACADIPQLYRLFFGRRALLFGAQSPACLPFSQYFADMERELNDHRYHDSHYALGRIDKENIGRFEDWQSGWVGGGMMTLPLLCDGSELSRQRAVETLRFAARNQSAAGFYYGIVQAGRVHHDAFDKLDDRYSMLLIRKHADLTAFMFRHIAAMERMGMAVPDEVRASAVSAADALVTLWRRYGQLGQFVNCETGEIVVGGSTSGGMAPAALCAAYSVTGNAAYLDAAREIARYYYREAIQRGVTTGGPGEILQAPDSESIIGLLESYVALFELDGGDEWLGMACDAAHQAASWIVPYDYAFPADSRFGRRGVLAAGSVWANVQNKHSAPGLCTASPATLLKLYRATGNADYLELMRQVARFSPQVASRSDCVMYQPDGQPLPIGAICERVNMSDWEGTQGVGDSIFGSSSWPETALLLTCLEIPGVYVVRERGVVCASDHVNAWLEGDELVIANPTAHDARVKVLAESPADMERVLGIYWQERFTCVDVAAGAQARVALA